ncbi:MAG TPA: DUF4340 domain-containing protein [Anaerolineales bacterium]|nr:DUF4340 domain-containing protein [Anaerolineales bacterium]
MIRRNTLILVGVFLLALAGYVLLNRQQEQAAAQITPTAATQPLFEFEASELTGIQVADSSGREVRLEMMSGAWVLVDPTAEATDTERVTSLATQIASLTARSLIENPPAASAMGLEPPAYTVRLQLGDGSRLTLEVGAETPTQSGYYVRLADGRVAVVSTFSVDGITAVLDSPPVYLTPTVGITPFSPDMLPTSGAGTTPTP